MTTTKACELLKQFGEHFFMFRFLILPLANIIETEGMVYGSNHKNFIRLIRIDVWNKEKPHRMPMEHALQVPHLHKRPSRW